MRQTSYDPLTHIPSPETLRRHLTETETLAQRLRILLRVSEELHNAGECRQGSEQDAKRAASGQEVSRAS